MSRKRRRKRAVDHGLTNLTTRPEWRWRTLPVWVALAGGFVIGWFVGTAWFGEDISYYVWVAAFGGFWFGISRMIGRLLIDPIVARRRLRRQEEAQSTARRERRQRGGESATKTPPPGT